MRVPFKSLRGACVVAILLGVAWLLRDPLDIAVSSAWAGVQGPYSVEDRLAQFGPQARARLVGRFEQVGVPYPGTRIALLAFKDTHQLELYAQNSKGLWRFVHRYPVLAASGSAGPKLRESDGQVPEGHYRVTFLNANSLYHVSLRLDYPNAFDRQMAQQDGRAQLGGDIMIHGRAVSIGCLAMGDEAAEDLFTLAANIGMARIDVLIAPTDFRRNPDYLPETDLPWLPALYSRLIVMLGRFPAAAAYGVMEP